MTNQTPLTIGIVGLNFGRRIVDELLQKPACDYFRIGAVCDMNQEKAQSFAGTLKVKAYADLDRLLADPDIPVIGLFTGPDNRAQLLRKIIHAGKDVMTTKPFELDPTAARKVLEEAASLGRAIHLNSPSPVPPEWVRQVLAWQEKYDLGRPVSCHSETMVSYRETTDGSWYDDSELCPAAPIFRLGVYLINDLVRLFGGVAEVQVLGSRLFTRRPTIDNAHLSLLFNNEAVGSIHANFCVDDGQFYANSFILHYERGTVYRNIRLMPYGAANVGSRLQLVAKTGGESNVIEESEIPDVGGNYQWGIFYDSVTQRKIIPTPVDDIVHGVEVLAAMKRAEKSRRTEHV